MKISPNGFAQLLFTHADIIHRTSIIIQISGLPFPIYSYYFPVFSPILVFSIQKSVFHFQIDITPHLIFKRIPSVMDVHL